MRIVCALCLMLISTGCHANDIMQGHWESSRPSAGRKANGHFGANMVLTASESQVRRDWVKYKANPRIPLLTSSLVLLSQRERPWAIGPLLNGDSC